MFRWLRGKLSRLRQALPSSASGVQVSGHLSVNREHIKNAFGDSSDLVLRELAVGTEDELRLLVVHIDGLASKQLITDAVIRRITSAQLLSPDPSRFYAQLRDRLIAASGVDELTSMDEVISHITQGDCLLFVDGHDQALSCSVRDWERRSIAEPTTESTIRGTKEGFVEVVRVNTSILRRLIMHPRLRIEETKVGALSRTKVAITYIDGLASEELLHEVRHRLRRIDTDAIRESGNLEEYIEDAPLSPFPTVLRTERPDKVAGALLEGRVALFTEGTPFALILPVTFFMYLTSPEDYFERFFVGTFLRMLRTAGLFMSLSLPAFYVAITTFHQEMLPTPLILSIAAQRKGVPFPALAEALLMELTFELLREAGVRLPRVVGPAVSIIGALVLGDAAIRAGLVSPAMVVVVAFTGIASFATPVFSLAIGVRLLRFLMMLLSATLGLFGIVAGFFALLIHLVSLRSFGIPYLEPFAPMVVSDVKDTLVRAPWWALDRRPQLLAQEEPTRQGSGLKPRPPREAEAGEED